MFFAGWLIMGKRPAASWLCPVVPCYDGPKPVRTGEWQAPRVTEDMDETTTRHAAQEEAEGKPEATGAAVEQAAAPSEAPAAPPCASDEPVEQADGIEPSEGGEAEEAVAPPGPAKPAGGRGGKRLGNLAALVLLTVLSIFMLAPGIGSMPVTDRDEALFVQASRQMLESGDWIDIRFQTEPRYKKPVGIYWLQVLAAEATGKGADAPIWAYRLPSVIGGVLVVLFAFGIGSLMGGPVTGLLTGLLAMTVVEFGVEARLAKTDAVLAATVLAGQFALAHAYLDIGRRRIFWRNALFWTAIGVGALIKGPLTALVVGLTLLTLSLMGRSTALWRSLSPVKGLLWVAAMVLPWLVAIGWISHGAFFRQSVGGDLLAKVAAGQEGHGKPPGTYLIAAIGLWWPLTALVPLGIGYAWRNRRELRVQYALAWLIPNWLVFEFIPTKLPNYVLPEMVAVALLTAFALVGPGLAATDRWRRWVFAYIAVGAVGFGLGLNGVFVYAEGRADFIGLALGIVAAAIGILAWRLLLANRLWPAVAALVATMMCINTLAYAVLLPGAEKLWLSERLADAAAEIKPCAAPTTLVVDYIEPSVVYRLGTDVQLTSAEKAADTFAAATCAVAFIKDDATPAFLAAFNVAAPGMVVPVPVKAVTARNINGFRLRTMQVFAKGG